MAKPLMMAVTRARAIPRAKRELPSSSRSLSRAAAPIGSGHHAQDLHLTALRVDGHLGRLGAEPESEVHITAFTQGLGVGRVVEIAQARLAALVDQPSNSFAEGGSVFPLPCLPWGGPHFAVLEANGLRRDVPVLGGDQGHPLAQPLGGVPGGGGVLGGGVVADALPRGFGPADGRGHQGPAATGRGPARGRPEVPDLMPRVRSIRRGET